MGITRTGIMPRERFRVMYKAVPTLAGVAAKSIPPHLDMIVDSRLPFKVARGVLKGSLSNGRGVAIEMKNGGRKLRIPTEPELLKLNELLGDQLEGRDFWIMTETEHEDYPGHFVLRLRNSDNRFFIRPVGCCDGDAVRFVEDK